VLLLCNKGGVVVLVGGGVVVYEGGVTWWFVLFVVGPHCVVQGVMDQFRAAKVGDVQQLRLALTVNNVDVVDDYGWTALLYASRNGHVDCVRYCIKMGTNVNARTRNGYNVVHCTSFKGHGARIVGCGCNG
jgi:hypothetical protein